VATIQFLTALLKHWLESKVGKEVLGGEKLDQTLDEWFVELGLDKKISQAATLADDLFIRQYLQKDKELAEWMVSLPLRDLPELQQAIAGHPRQSDDSRLVEAIQGAIQARWQGLSAAQIGEAAQTYLGCLYDALTPVKDVTYRLLQSMLEKVQKVDQVTQHIDQTTVDNNNLLRLILERLGSTPLPQAPSLLLTSLPRRAEHFTGREKEMKKLLDLLKPGCQVTLVAAGGMGKTALAAEALYVLYGDDDALRKAFPEQFGILRERFPDGLFYHAFYHQKEADLCLEAICRAFGEQPLPSAEVAARRALAGKKALLVLDGTEETDNLPAVLSVCGGCGVLVTTRKKTDAQGGELIEVKPLPEDKSLKLLHKWAGKYALDEGGEAQSAKEIIRLTGGLPLATSIVGKYLKQKPEYALDYVKWLRESRLEALTQGERQKESVPLLLERSLKQVPEDSCTLLALSAALAYAAFPVDLLWAGAGELKTETQKRKALDPLLDYGLLIKGGSAREYSGYQVAHLLLYAYARQKLELENERLLRMAIYGIRLAQREVPKGPPGFRFLDAYRPHLIWLETRLLTMQGEGKGQAAALGLVSGLAWALLNYLYLDGHWVEWLDSMQAALESARLAKDRRWEGAWLGNLGNAYASLGQYDRAIEHYQQALAISREIGDRRGEGQDLGNLGNAYLSLGQYEKAIEHYRQALGIARETGDRKGEGNSLGNLGNAYRSLGQYQKAIEHHQQALGIARETGGRQLEGSSLGSLGSAYQSLGQYQKAIEHHQQALGIARQIGDRQLEGNKLGSLGSAYQSLGQYDKAIEHYQQALEIARQIGSRQGEGMWLGSLGNAYDSLGQYDMAIEYYQQALEIAQQIGDRQGEGQGLGNLGNAYQSLGQYDKAIEHHQQALRIDREIGYRRGEGQDLGNLGNAYGSLGQYEKAIEHHQQALRIAQEIGDRRGEGQDLGNLGIAYQAFGQYDKAIGYYQQALKIAREIGDRQGEGADLGNLGNAYENLRQHEKGIEHYQQALAIAREIGDRQGEGNRLANLGLLHEAQGDMPLARQHWKQALQIYEQIGVPEAEVVREWLEEAKT
jgi:tetratricopeptide (TPR) repeat protein